MSRLVELPQGIVIEVRRGSHDSLRQLAGDMSRLGISGHIRIERKPKELMPRVSQILIKDGIPIIAIHESDMIQMGLEALVEIESDSTALDALISLHELSKEEIDQIIRLYPDAHINSHGEENNSHEGQWWNQVRLQSRRWIRENRLPELETTVDAPEIIRQKSVAQLRRLEGQSRTLNLGDVLLTDSEDSKSIIELTGILAGHGRPIMVISRSNPHELNRQYDIPLHSSIWLSSNDDINAVKPDLDIIRKKVLNFLWANKQAIIAIDGLEYLSSKNDDSSLLNFIRTISDEIRMEDHALLLSCDLSSFIDRTRHLLLREVEEVKEHIFELWAMESESLFQHPICVELSEEESVWIEQQLSLVSFTSDEMMASLEGTLSGGSSSIEQEDALAAGENLAKVVEEWSEKQIPLESPIEPKVEVLKADKSSDYIELEDDNLVIPAQSEIDAENPADDHQSELFEMVEQPNISVRKIKKAKGPRKAIRIKRRKIKRKVLRDSNINDSKISISAAAQNKVHVEGFKDTDRNVKASLSFSANIEQIADKQDSAFIKTFKSSNTNNDSSLTQASKQRPANTKVSKPIHKSPIQLGGLNSEQKGKVKTKLDPLLARGVPKDKKKSKFARESASRSQSHTSIEQRYEDWKNRKRR